MDYYKTKKMEQQLIDLTKMPKTKYLLKQYVLFNYEEHAITDDHHLLMEYHLLQRQNQLHFLFELESWLNSEREIV